MTDLPRLAPQLLDRRLENGLRLILLPDRSRSLVAVNLWYHVGSRDDPHSRSGLAHLFEHMLFQGSEHVQANEHFQLVQQAGGTTNASTSFDRTNYYETLPPHWLELGLWLESDRMGFLLPALDSEKLEGQRSVVMNERRERIDNQPYGRAFEALQEALFPDGHPYRRPIIGHMEDIRAATLGDAEAFFQRHYTPSNAVLSLVGDLDPDAAEAMVRRYFGEIPAPAAARNTAEWSPAASQQAAERSLEDDVALSRIYLAWRSPGITHDERYAGEILATALGGGKSSPLYQDLVHRGQIAQDVSVFLLTLELESVFAVVATARPDIDIDEVEGRIVAHIERASREAPDPEDFARARNQVATGLFEQMESVESLADLLSQAAIYFDDPAAIDREAERFFECGRDDLSEFAARYLRPDRAARIRVVPRTDRENHP